MEFSFQKSQSWANIKTRQLQLQLQLGSERRRDGGGKGDRGLKKERKKERSLLPLSMKAKPNKSNISNKKGDKLLDCFKILRYFLPCPPLIMLRTKECSL